MKKILLAISFLVCALHSFSQAPQPRSSPIVTAVDARLRAGLNFGMPITQDTTLNGGLDSLGGLIYAKLYRSVFVRDTNTVGGGHLWTNLSLGSTGIKSLNGLTGATQTFAIGTAGSGFNISSVGSVHTFNLPFANGSGTSGIISSATFISFTNKVNSSDTAAMLAGYAQNVVLTMPTNTFSSPNVFSGSHVKTGAVTFINQSNNTFLAGPATIGVGAVSWRLMVNADLPISPVTPGTYTNTTVTVNQQGIVTGIANGTALGGQFYDSITQVNDSTFTLDRPNGTHDTVQIKITVSPAISTLNNGLTLTGTNGQLGGTLIKNTTIFGGGFYTAFVGGRVELGQGVAVASAANFTVGNDGNLFSVTGNNQINAITNTNWNAGSEIGLIFTGTPLLKNNTVGGVGTSPMLLAGSTDYTAAAGDYIGLRFDGFFWHETTRKLTGAGGVYVFSNGLTEFPATKVKLGGTFTQNTTFAGNGFWLAMSGGRFQLGSGIAIASANNLITGNDGNQFSVTGNTQINALTTLNWQSGAHLELIFTGTPTLKNNTAGGVNTAPMLLAGSIDYTAAAGDLIGFSYDGTVWHETNRKLAGAVSAGVVSANNGLTLNIPSNVQLGGVLSINTTINQNSHTMFWTGAFNGVLNSVQNLGSGAGTFTAFKGQAVSFSGANNLTGVYGLANGINSGVNIGGQFEGDVGTGGGTQAYGVYSQSDHGIGVYGFSLDGIGVLGQLTSGGAGSVGVKGDATSGGGRGVYGITTTGVGVYGLASGVGGTGVYGEADGTGASSVAISGNAQGAGSLVGQFLYQDNTTNTVITNTQYIRGTNGTAANGIGQSLDFYVQNITNATNLSNQIISKWSDATFATRTSQFVLTGVNSAATTTLITFNGNGQGIMSNSVASADLFSVSNTEPSANNTAIRGTSINGAGVVGSSTSGTGVIGTSTNAFGGQFSSSTGAGVSVVSNSSSNSVALFTLVPASTNTVRNVATFTRNTSGTGANGIGSSIQLVSQTSTSTNIGNTLISTLTNATGASPTSQFSIRGNNASISDALIFILNGNGTVNYPLVANWGNFANNAAAITGGLVVGDLYRNGDVVQIVH